MRTSQQLSKQIKRTGLVYTAAGRMKDQYWFPQRLLQSCLLTDKIISLMQFIASYDFDFFG